MKLKSIFQEMNKQFQCLQSKQCLEILYFSRILSKYHLMVLLYKVLRLLISVHQLDSQRLWLRNRKIQTICLVKLILPHLRFHPKTIQYAKNKKQMQIFERYRQKYGIPVFVLRTNFNTLKGQLIRVISFPIEKQNIFEIQSAKFLIFMFLSTFISFGIIGYRFLGRIKMIDILIKYLNLVTIGVPPGLPVSMTFGVIHAVKKLKQKDIFCISPNKVILTGFVNLICFDKTGTLTEDYMDFKSLKPCRNGVFLPDITQSNSHQTKKTSCYKQMYHLHSNMASNHTIVQIQATGERVGDPMELKLFQFGNYLSISIDRHQLRHTFQQKQQSLFAFKSVNDHIGVVIKRMDFDSELQRMSVITKNYFNQQLKDTAIYTKGSPQSIYNICRKDSIPQQYFQVLKQYASLGLRVLGICHRLLDLDNFGQRREQIENNMIFDGFEVFQNKLKPQTIPTIHQLLQAEIPCIIITGDNPLTACNIGLQSRILNREKRVIIYSFNQQRKEVIRETFHSELVKFQPQLYQNEEFKPLDFQLEQLEYQKEQIQLQSFSNIYSPLINTQTDQTQSLNKIIKQINFEIRKGAQICMTGNLFNAIFSDISEQPMDLYRRNILKATKIFARAKPIDKAKIVKSYQIGLKKIVSMCGDGANDSGALKQSDGGLSFSQAQASISAPFTSKVSNISAMIDLIKQCRAGLVTNLSLFNIMALYAVISYSTTIICEFYFSNPNDIQYLYWDIFCNFFPFIVFGYTGSAQKLSKIKPAQSLFALTNLFQIIVMACIQLISQIFMIYSIRKQFASQTQYSSRGGSQNNIRSYLETGHLAGDSSETSTLFLFSNFMYIFSFVAFSISAPWRKEFYTNIPLMIILVLILGYSVLIVLIPQVRVYGMKIEIIEQPTLKRYILMCGIGFGLMLYGVQKILEKISNKIRSKYSKYPCI